MYTIYVYILYIRIYYIYLASCNISLIKYIMYFYTIHTNHIQYYGNYLLIQSYFELSPLLNSSNYLNGFIS